MNAFRRIRIVVGTILLSAGLLPGAELDPLVRRGEALWALSGAEILRQYPGFFRWMDRGQNRLRFNRNSGKKNLTLFAVPLEEVICECRRGKLDAVQVSIYNRGDAGPMAVRDFNALVDRMLRETARQFGGGRVPERRKVTVAKGSVYAANWRMPGMNITLRWSVSDRNTPEYILLIFQPPADGGDTLRGEIKTRNSARNLRQNLQRDPDGTVYLLVPMVDQGAKGYCAAATVARVLNYYGADVDQHLIAQLAKSDAQAGTGIGEILNNLDKAQSRLGIRVKTYCSCLLNYNDWMNFIKEYNKFVRKNKIPEVDLKQCYVKERGGKIFSPALAMRQMDRQTMNRVRALDKNARDTFFRQIRESIDMGLPLCWTTMVIAPDRGAPGLHMRLITGYHPATGAVVYSDSWGAGHEKKVMSGTEAWGVTRHLFGILPRVGSR